MSCIIGSFNVKRLLDGIILLDGLQIVYANGSTNSDSYCRILIVLERDKMGLYVSAHMVFL